MSEYLDEIENQMYNIDVRFRQITSRRESMWKEGRSYQETVYGNGSWDREWAELREEEISLDKKYNELNLFHAQERSRLGYDDEGDDNDYYTQPSSAITSPSHDQLAMRAAKNYVAGFASGQVVEVKTVDQIKRLCKVKFKYNVGFFNRSRTEKIQY